MTPCSEKGVNRDAGLLLAPYPQEDLQDVAHHPRGHTFHPELY